MDNEKWINLLIDKFTKEYHYIIEKGPTVAKIKKIKRDPTYS